MVFSTLSYYNHIKMCISYYVLYILLTVWKLDCKLIKLSINNVFVIVVVCPQCERDDLRMRISKRTVQSKNPNEILVCICQVLMLVEHINLKYIGVD